MFEITRRSFLKISKQLLTYTGLAVVLGPVIAYFYPPELEEVPSEPVLAGTLEEIPVGSAKTVRFGRYPALIINTPEGIKAFSAVCTHFACIVKWDGESNQIICPCHEGYFDPQDGSVISGPPPKALETLPITLSGNEIYVGGQA